MAPPALVKSDSRAAAGKSSTSRVRPPVRPRSSPGRILITAVMGGGLTAALALIAAVRVLSWLDISGGRGWTVAVAVWTVAWACVGTWTGQPLFVRLTARSHRR